MDYPKVVNDRSDFIGGIDNEALDFGHLDNFIQVAAVVGNIDETSSASNNATTGTHGINSINNNSTNVAIINTRADLSPKTQLTAINSNNSNNNNNNTNLPLTTISAHVSVTSSPIGTPTATAVALALAQNTPHLPESPPDSGSEPPYSPLQETHGLTLTARDTYNANMPTIAAVTTGATLTTAAIATTLQQDLQLSTQFASPAQQQHHYTHIPEQQLGVRVKHEGGLIINPTTLLQPLQHPHSHQHQQHQQQQYNQQTQQHHAHETHIDIAPQAHINGPQLLYANANNLMHYEPPPYPTNGGYHPNMPEPIANNPICGTILNDMPHVEVVGTHTPRTSAPSTPVHNTRKRKMSTQLDYVDYPNIKSDPGLKMSPIRATEPPKLAPTSPASLQHEMAPTPAHSSASLSPALSTVNSNNDNSMDATNNNNGANNDPNADPNAMSPCIRFSPFQPHNWHKLCDQHLQDLSVVYYRVDADKGFNFSVSDDAFVCQKKNHFQITCHARLQGDAKFVKTPSGIEKIKAFHLHFYGVKLEAPNQTIRVEQSQSDRSKKPFFPVPIDLQSHIVSKITVGRLHFSETTNNNMRKKGRPNPEQRYFQLVVALHVHTASGNYPVISQASERIIVRASNPGQFESDVDLCWQRGLTQDSIFHAGRVGINTDRPDESLVVHGNLKISGHIVQPSDSRAKKEISELDTSVQLRNLQKIRIVRYRYDPQFAIHSGLKRASGSDSEEIIDTGVIAQEVREVIPDAVQEGGRVVLPNGNVIEKFLLVNKDRILMENIGAVKELCKVTGALANRVEHLEQANNRLVRTKEFEQKYLRNNGSKMCSNGDGFEICSNRTLQIVIFMLVIVMAVCLAAVSTLYFVEHNQQQNNLIKLEKLHELNNRLYLLHGSVQHNEHERNNLINRNKTHLPWQSLLVSTTTTRPSALNAIQTKTHEELSYSESRDGGRNDELDVIMEKPHITQALITKHNYRISTTAPVVRNKTLSKNKSKWTEVIPSLRAVQSLQKQTSAAIKRLESTAHQNASETSAEKAVDTVPLPQDFENNSIDIDAQLIAKKPAAANKITVENNRLESSIVLASPNAASAHDLAFEDSTGDVDIALKIAEHITIASTLTNNNHVSGIVPATTTIAQREPYIGYKTASPPTVTQLLTTNKVAIENTQTNYSIETPPTSNRSKTALDNTFDNPDALELQVLSATNETVDNPITALFGFDAGSIAVRESTLGRRSTSAHNWETQRTIQVDMLGELVQCLDKLLTNCQTTCNAEDLIDNSQTSQIAQQQKLLEQSNQQSVDAVLNLASLEDEEMKDLKSSPKTTHNTKLVAQRFSADQQEVADAENIELNEHILSVEPLDIKTKLIDATKTTHLLPKQPPNKNQETTTDDCSRIFSSILANKLNSTFGIENFCPTQSKSLQVTYIIPISRYLIGENVELHLSYSKPLNWFLCKNNLLVANTSNKKLINTQTHQQHNSANIIQQRQQNKAILFLDIPQYGSFEREIILRAVNDTKTQNICSDSALASNTILQYNFRILRDCD